MRAIIEDDSVILPLAIAASGPRISDPETSNANEDSLCRSWKVGSKPTALEFVSKFLEAYNLTWTSLSQDEQKEIWVDKDKWNRLMLWRTARRPCNLDKTVLERTADAMGLEYYEGEPLHLDGAFYSKTHALAHRFPFPIIVAFEHENNHRTFDDEVVKLLSIRCRLKVGITYTQLEGAANTARGRQRALEDIHQMILRDFNQIAEITGEDALSEYLFLIGVEIRIHSLQWQALTFSAGNGTAGSSFSEAQRNGARMAHGD